MAELLTLNNIHSGYGRIPVIFGVDLSIEKGGFLGLLGHNGMGKSTLLKTIAGHVPAKLGSIRFDNTDITRARVDQRARLGIGYVPQGRQIFPSLTVLENLRMGASKKPRKDADDVVESVLKDLPRLSPLLDRRGGVLSGGEQQILALGRALCASPALLLLDEPTEGIQPSLVEEMKHLLVQLASSRALTIILVEQNVKFLCEITDNIRIIRKGRISDQIDAGQLRDDSEFDAVADMGLFQ